jgi:CheY-like chemotaxis protein
VLIADDCEDMREFLADSLRSRFSVDRQVGNGRCLIEAVLARPPDVIVSDLNMPVLGGLGALVALRELGCDIPFIVVSAEPGMAGDCLALGALGFVTKLDASRELIPAVLAALEGRSYVSSRALGSAGGTVPGTPTKPVR